MFEVKNLSIDFSGRTIFENINFKIEEKDFVIIMGESGCGKTTLLNCLTMLECFSSGDIIYNNQSYNSLSNSKKIKILKQDFGIVFQDFGLIDDISVYKNLSFVNKNKSRVREALKEFNINVELNTKAAVLSGGEKQRLALARIALKRCKVIFADEPTGNLDDENEKTVMDYLKKLNENGKTVIVVTHNQALKSYANKVIVMEDFENSNA